MSKKVLWFLAAFCFWFVQNTLQAQTRPPIEWQKTFGGTLGDKLTSLVQTSDGGYIFAGTSSSDISSNKTAPKKGIVDYWIVKTDANGNQLWDKTFGGTDEDWLSTVQQTTDGGFMLGGYSKSPVSGDKTTPNKGDFDFWIVKLDANGIKQWDKTIGSNDDDILKHIEQTSDGGYVMGGYTRSYHVTPDKSQPSWGIGYNDFWIVKTDSLGNKIWDKTLGGSLDDEAYSLQQTTDGGYIIGGRSRSPISGNKTQASLMFYDDYWVVKLDADGLINWDKTIGGRFSDELRFLQQTTDGGYILGGDSDSDISGDKSQANKGWEDFWLVKINAQGVKQWDKTIGGRYGDNLTYLQQTADGGYMLGGLSDSDQFADKSQPAVGNQDYWLVKLNASGIKQWDKTIGGNDTDALSIIQPVKTGGYIMGGESMSVVGGDKTQPFRGGSDFWVVKLSPTCPDLAATLTATCTNGNISVNATITGLQPLVSGSGTWTLAFSVNGVNQTISGSSGSFTLANNAALGTNFALTNITSGSCNNSLSATYTVAIPVQQPAITLISPDTLFSSVAGTSYEWKLNGTTFAAKTRKLKATVPGVYAVRVINEKNCASLFSQNYNLGVSGLEEKRSNNFALFPNPTTGLLTLEFPNNHSAEVKILNALGQQVLQKTVSDSAGRVTLDLKHVAKGMYVAQVTTGGQLFIKKFVIE